MHCFSCTKRFPEEARQEMEIADALAHKLYSSGDIDIKTCVGLLNRTTERYHECMNCLVRGGIEDD